MPRNDPIEVRAIISLNEQLARDIATQDERNHTTQNSIKNATWWAFGAVAAYAVVTTFMWCAMIEQNKLAEQSLKQSEIQWKAQNRPWVANGDIGFKQPPIFSSYPDNPVEARTQITFDIEIPIKNVGIAPAFHVGTGLMGTMTKEIASPPNIDTMMESACGFSSPIAKHAGDVLFPNSLETRKEWPENIMVPFIAIGEVRRVWLDICIVYGSSTDSQGPRHHTKIWMASWPINGPPVETRRTANPRVLYYSLPITQWSIVRTEAD